MRIFALGLLLLTASAGAAPPVRIASKQFTESVILGEILKQLVESAGVQATHRAELGSTRIVWNALLSRQIDAYPEYTGTLTEELLAREKLHSPRQLRAALAQRGIQMTERIGFNNTYAIGMKEDVAARLGVRTLSDLARHPELRLGFSNEFKSRADGWPKLQAVYHMPQKDVRGLDHDVAYRGLANGDLDAVDLYSTDAEIEQYHLRILEDDQEAFPRYEAVVLYRGELAKENPEAVRALESLQEKISGKEMTRMNARAKLGRVPESRIAQEFIASHFQVHQYAGEKESSRSRILRTIGEHLSLVLKSLLAAILVGVPLGILSARKRTLGQGILSVVGIIQTIPALALLVLLIAPLSRLGFSGIGDTPAIVALFLYSLLPIVRNTQAGLSGIPGPIRESAEALGLDSWSRLRLIELPLATPFILSGIKTAAVINVGFATLGALIGAGGLGQPILTGIRLDQYGLILEGAVPAAALAILTQLLFDAIERFLVPRELRVQ